MPIGATIGAAVVAGGASVASGAMASHAQNKAANKAASIELQVADKNNAFAQSMYDQNEGHLSPFIDFGTAAGGDLMELLLGKPKAAPTSTGATGGTTTGGTPAKTGYTGPSFDQIVAMKGDHVPGDMTSAIDGWVNYYQGHPDENPGVTAGQVAGLQGDHIVGDEAAVNNVLSAYAARPHTATPATPSANNAVAPVARPRFADYAGDPAGFRNALAAYREAGPASAPTTPTTGTGTPAAGGTGNAAQDAWDKFRNSTNYQFRLDQGLNSTATKYAAAGAFESGAEKKAINDYAQNFASNELANYMDQLYRQEALGASAASSLAGVGSHLVDQVSANNNNAASAAANAALVHGQNSANMWGTVGNAVGQIAGAVGGAAGSSIPSYGSGAQLPVDFGGGGSLFQGTSFPTVPDYSF